MRKMHLRNEMNVQRKMHRPVFPKVNRMGLAAASSEPNMKFPMTVTKSLMKGSEPGRVCTKMIILVSHGEETSPRSNVIGEAVDS